MNIKILEIRDEGTFIPVLCIDMNEPANEIQRWYMRRCGYPLDARPNIAITNLNADSGEFTNDPWGWRSYRGTMAQAHHHIIRHWGELADGDVIDVQFIAGETKEKKISERLTDG